MATKVHTLNVPQGARRKNENERVTSELTDNCGEEATHEEFQ